MGRPGTDPLVQLRHLVDLSLAELPNYLLAIRLADEIAGGAQVAGEHVRTYREGEAVFARLIAAAAPGMARAEATRVARDVLSAMVGSTVIRLDSEPEAALRQRVVAVLRMALVPAYVAPDRYETMMVRAEQMA